MYVDIETFSSGWIGIGVGLSATEVDALVAQLLAIRDASSNHFHFRSNYEGEPGVADIEFYVKAPDSPDNMTLG